MSDTQLSHLKQRIIFGGIAILCLVLLILYSQSPIGNIAFTAIIGIAAALSVWEFFQMTMAGGFHPNTFIGISATIAIIISTYLFPSIPISGAVTVFILIATVLLTSLTFFFKGSDPLSNIAITLLAQIYLAIPLACALLVCNLFPQGSTQDSRWWLFYLLAVTKVTDIAAYFIGKTYGKTKLARYISPNKTVEGAVGGFLVSILTSLAFYFASDSVTPSLQLTLFQSIWLGAILSILAQIGDLIESLLKRDAGIKDSNSLPGIGGMLDAVDSLIFTTPALLLFLLINYK